MSTIKGLIIKDFQTIKSYKTTVLFMIILFAACAFLNDNFITFFPIFMPLCFEMLGISSFSYDNLAKTDKYVCTFPVSKKEIVKARYIYILLATIIGTLLGLILVFIANMIKTSSPLDKEFLSNVLATIVGGFLGMIFLQTFQIPIMYKYGAEKGRIIQMIMIVVFMLGISLITTAIMNFLGITIDKFIVMLKDYLIAIIGIVIVMLYIFSFLISCKIYEKKEI